MSKELDEQCRFVKDCNRKHPLFPIHLYDDFSEIDPETGKYKDREARLQHSFLSIIVIVWFVSVIVMILSFILDAILK